MPNIRVLPSPIEIYFNKTILEISMHTVLLLELTKIYRKLQTMTNIPFIFFQITLWVKYLKDSSSSLVRLVYVVAAL